MLRKWCLVAAAVAVFASGVLAASTAAAPTKAVKATSNSVLWNQHGNSVPVGYCANFACTDRYFSNGSAVFMQCYVDTYPAAYGNYSSTRWFYVRYTNWFGSIYRWVHSSYVYYQTGVRHC